MTLSRALFSSQRQDWATPPELFAELDAAYGPFDLDAAATRMNAKCVDYLTLETMDATATDWTKWGHRRIWCNPPYRRDIGRWFEQARHAAMHGADVVVMLVPARTDTRWWHEHVQGVADEVRFLKGRVKFVGPDGVKSSAPFPSAVIVYRGKQGGAA